MLSTNRKTKGERIFDTLNSIFMLFVVVVMIYPFLNQIAISFSNNTSVISGAVSVFPKGFNVDAYSKLINDSRFFLSFKNTVWFTILGTVITMTIISIFAYPLSKKELKGRGIIMGLMVFSMMFGTGGLIPNYMVVKRVGLVDNYMGLILPAAINIWNIIVLKNFYQQIPGEIEESARMDGANNIVTFIKIILPLSVPSLAAITLFVAVSSWNTFFNALIYITSPEKKLLQVYLNDILQANILPETANSAAQSAESAKQTVNSDTLKAATLMCATVPILILYPFLQRYFMTGLMIGSVKG